MGRRPLALTGKCGTSPSHFSLCAALDDSARAQLAGLLARISAQQGLTPGVHPGFRKLGGGEGK